MFDVSFSELILIGIIALIVIGPERLPKVARTVGHLLGRAQRYVSDVKTDIKREMDLDELDNLKSQMEDAAKTVKESMHTAADDLRKPIEEAQKTLKEASQSIAGPLSAKTESGGPIAQLGQAAPVAGQQSAPGHVPETSSPATEESLPLPGFSDPDNPSQPVPGATPPLPDTLAIPDPVSTPAPAQGEPATHPESANPLEKTPT